MKKIFLSFCLILSVIACFGQSTGIQNTLYKLKLYGKVKIISTNSVSESEKQSEGILVYKHYLNPKGYLTKTEMYLKGKFDGFDTYSYNNNDSIRSISRFSKDSLKNSETVFTYNEKNYREKETGFDNDTISSIHYYRYNENGKCTEISYFLNEKFLASKNKYFYNDKGLLQKMMMYDNKDKVLYEDYNTYTPKNQLYQIRQNDFNDIDTKTKFTYDSNNYITSITTIDKMNVVVSYTGSENDPFGNAIKSTTKIPSMNFTDTKTTVYEYDQFNNWTKATTTSSKNKVTVIKRIIEYY